MTEQVTICDKCGKKFVNKANAAPGEMWHDIPKIQGVTVASNNDTWNYCSFGCAVILDPPAVLPEQTIPDWQQRLLEEKQQLDTRIQKLHAFLNVPRADIGHVEAKEMAAQLYFMVGYQLVLQSRLIAHGLTAHDHGMTNLTLHLHKQIGRRIFTEAPEVTTTSVEQLLTSLRSTMSAAVEQTETLKPQ